jgi:translation initiation factor 5
MTSKALMALYQADVLDEDVVRQWGTHVSKKYVDKDKSKKVRKSSDAFLKVSNLAPSAYTLVSGRSEM